MASDVTFKLHDDDPWEISEQAFAIITTHLKNPDDTAAARLNALNPLIRQPANGKLSEKPVSFLLEFWAVTLDIAKQIPHDHRNQDDLVDLLIQLSQQPSQDVEIWNKQQSMMGDLPLLREAIAEAAQDESFTSANFHGFVARLAASIDANLSYIGLWAFRDALECPAEKVSSNQVLAASTWILYAKSILLQNVHSEKEAMGGAGPLWKGQSTWNQERWSFWKHRLADLYRGSLLDEKTAPATGLALASI